MTDRGGIEADASEDAVAANAPAATLASGNAPLLPHLFEQMTNAVVHGELRHRDGAPDDFVFIYANPAFRKLSRLSKIAEVEGRRLSELLPEARTARAASFVLYDRVLRTGVSESYEQFIPALDSWFSVQVLRVADRQFLALFTDITASKTTEQTLERTQAMLRQAQGIARIGFWQFDLEGSYFLCSDGMRELYELDKDEPVNRETCARIVHDEDRLLLRTAFEASVAAGSQLDVRHRTLGKDGNVRYFQLVGRIDCSDDGSRVMIGTTQDVTTMMHQETALRDSERRLNATIEASSVPLALNDAQGRVLYLNGAFRRSFGYDLIDIPTLDHWWPCAYPDPGYRARVRDDWRARLGEARASGTPFQPIEVVIRAKDGSLRTAIASATSVGPAEDGVLLAEFYDITIRKQLEERLREKRAYLQSVIDASPNAMAMFDSDHRLIGFNRQFHEIHRLGPGHEFIPGTTTLDEMIRHFQALGYYPGWSGESALRQFLGYVERREHIHFERETAEGRVLDIDMIPLDSGGILVSYKDVTDRARKLDDARSAALHDPLTHLPNRRALEARYESIASDPSATQAHTGMLLIDLDRFKSLNDSLGHVYGDLLLIEVADRLRKCVRSSDLIARLGGDEFVVLLGELAEVRDNARLAAERAAEHIRDALAAPYHLRPATDEGHAGDTHVYTCSASIGGWILPRSSGTLVGAIKKADEALYLSKSRGRNTIVVR